MFLLNRFTLTFLFVTLSSRSVDGACTDLKKFQGGKYPWNLSKCEDLKLIMDYINYVRNQYAYDHGVQWMLVLQWSDELARSAQGSADRCEFDDKINWRGGHAGTRWSNGGRGSATTDVGWRGSEDYTSSHAFYGPYPHLVFLRKSLKDILYHVLDFMYSRGPDGILVHQRVKEVGCAFSYLLSTKRPRVREDKSLFFFVCHFRPRIPGPGEKNFAKGYVRNCEGYVPTPDFVSHKIFNSWSFPFLCTVPAELVYLPQCRGDRNIYARSANRKNATGPVGAGSGLPTALYTTFPLTLSVHFALLIHNIHL